MANAGITQSNLANPASANAGGAATNAASTPVLQARELELAGLPDSRIDLDLFSGERWLITGAAGSGKTTLARTLLGLISPTAGRIALFGQDLDDLAPDALLALRRTTVLISPSDGLFPAWSGFDNLALPLRYHGVPGTSGTAGNGNIEAQIIDRARAYGLPEAWLEQAVTARSREQRLVLALIRATVAAPRLLIIDGIDLEHTFTAAGIHSDALFADLLADQPAIVILRSLETDSGSLGAANAAGAASAPGISIRLPPAFDPPRFRHGRLDAGTLQWRPAQD